MPQITGGMNHLAADAGHNRFFVTAPPDQKLVIVDLRAGKVFGIITGYKPAAARFAPDLNQLCVSGAKAVTIYDGDSFAVLGKIALNGGVDELQYDAHTHRLYAGIQDAAHPAIAVIDLNSRKLLTYIKLSAKPQGFVMNASGTRLYANTTTADSVTVIDCQKLSVIAEWKLTSAQSNCPIALDNKTHRLFVGCRKPACLLILDAYTGKPIASIATGGGTDDMGFDPFADNVYVSCATGVITVIHEDNADQFSKLADVSTPLKSRNSLFVPELREFFLAVPRQQNAPAELRLYKANQ